MEIKLNTLLKQIKKQAQIPRNNNNLNPNFQHERIPSNHKNKKFINKKDEELKLIEKQEKKEEKPRVKEFKKQDKSINELLTKSKENNRMKISNIDPQQTARIMVKSKNIQEEGDKYKKIAKERENIPQDLNINKILSPKEKLKAVEHVLATKNLSVVKYSKIIGVEKSELNRWIELYFEENGEKAEIVNKSSIDQDKELPKKRFPEEFHNNKIQTIGPHSPLFRAMSAKEALKAGIKKTGKELNIPKNTLQNWVNRLRKIQGTLGEKTYSNEFTRNEEDFSYTDRLQIVKESFGEPIKIVSFRNGITQDVVEGWRDKYADQMMDINSNQQSNSSTTSTNAEDHMTDITQTQTGSAEIYANNISEWGDDNNSNNNSNDNNSIENIDKGIYFEEEISTTYFLEDENIESNEIEYTEDRESKTLVMGDHIQSNTITPCTPEEIVEVDSIPDFPKHNYNYNTTKFKSKGIEREQQVILPLRIWEKRRYKYSRY